MSENFHFILKTPRSASLSHGDDEEEAYNARCHAQTQRRVKSRSSTPTVVPGGRRPPQQPSHQSKLQPQSTSHLIESDAANSNLTPGLATTKSVWYLEYQYAASGDHWTPLSSSPSNSGADPFNSTIMPSDSITHQIFQFMTSDFHRTNFAAESLRSRSSMSNTMTVPFRHEAAFTERIQSCFHDQVVLHTSLAYAAAAMGWRLGMRFQERPPEFYIQKAYVAVRDRLAASSEASAMLIMSVYSLGMAEAWTQNYDAAVAHMGGVLQLARQLGGLVHLSSYVMESVILGAKFLALFSCRPPVITLDWEPSAWSRPHTPTDLDAAQREAPKFGESFFALENATILDDELKSIISDVISLIKVHNWASNQQRSTPDVEQWLYLKTQAISHRLLCYQAGGESSREILRIALMLWILTITDYVGAQAAAYMYSDHLQSAEAHYAETEEDSADGLRLWSNCVGAMIALPAVKLQCSNQGTCSCPSHKRARFFVQRVAELGRGLNMAVDVEMYRQFLEGYFYIDDRQGERLAQLVEAVGGC